MKTRSQLLETRVRRLRQALSELQEAWNYVRNSNPQDSLRLTDLEREIGLAEIELETSQRVLELHRKGGSKANEVGVGLLWAVFLGQLLSLSRVVA